MSFSQYTPSAQQAKDLADKAVADATRQATDDFLALTLVSINTSANAQNYQLVVDYSTAGSIDVNRIIHVLGVELKYKVSQNVSTLSFLVDWSNIPSVAPPTRDGTQVDSLGQPLQ